jgi:hypothetical protein
VLSRVYELRSELCAYLIEEKQANAEQLTDSHFLIKLEYLCDIFEKLNLLNTALQGNETHILQLFDKVTAFMKK